MKRAEINNVDIRHIFDVTKITGFYLMILVRHLGRLLIDFLAIYFLAWDIVLKNVRNVVLYLMLTMKVSAVVILKNHD